MNNAAALTDALITGFKREKWKSEPMRKALEIASQHPEAVPDLAITVMRELPQGGTYLDATLSFLPMSGWEGTVDVAVSALCQDLTNSAAQRVIEYAALQKPTAVHPHLSELYHLHPSPLTFSEAYRETGLKDVQFLFAELTGRERDEASRLLMETRLPECFRFVISRNASFSAWTTQVGYEQSADGFRRLYPEQPLHLAFPVDYLARTPLYGEKIPWQFLHPTWRLGDIYTIKYRFGGTGGASCGTCGSPLHHLLTLQPVPEGVCVSELHRLELAVCLSCLGWERERLFYRHDHLGVLGEPSDFESQAVYVNPQFPAKPLLETEVALVGLGPRWQWQEWGASNGRENLHRLGGHPSWVQSAEYPACPQCSQTMTFLMQFDSELLDVNGQDWLWGSGGICYIHWCDQCKVSSFAWQCT